MSRDLLVQVAYSLSYIFYYYSGTRRHGALRHTSEQHIRCRVKQKWPTRKYCSQTPNSNSIERSSGKVQFPPNTFEVSITRLSRNSFIVIRVVMSLEMLAKLLQKHLS